MLSSSLKSSLGTLMRERECVPISIFQRAIRIQTCADAQLPACPHTFIWADARWTHMWVCDHRYVSVYKPFRTPDLSYRSRTHAFVSEHLSRFARSHIHVVKEGRPRLCTHAKIFASTLYFTEAAVLNVVAQFFRLSCTGSKRKLPLHG